MDKKRQKIYFKSAVNIVLDFPSINRDFDEV